MSNVLRALSALALCAAWASMTGCGGAGGGSPTTIVAVGVAVSFDHDVDPLPFDPRADRLRSASEQLAALAGHPVAFRFDTALLPEYRSSFESALIEAVEVAAQDVKYLKEREPEVFARDVPLLERIECHYDAAATENDATFDAERKTLTVEIHPNAYALLARGLLAGALEDENARYLEAHFGSLAPSQVSAGEQARYFHFLVGYRPHGPKWKSLDSPDGFVDDPKATEILRAAELYALVRDAALRADILKWLVDRGDYFSSAYVQHPSLVVASPASSAFHRAEAAWVKSVAGSVASMTDAERLTFARTIFVRMFNDDEPKYGRFSSFSFPGIDPVAFGLAVVDEWRKAGHPIEIPDAPERAQLYEFVVCPHPVDERGSRSRAPRCDYDFYQLSLATPKGRDRLAEALLARRDPTFTEMAILNVGYHGGPDLMLELFRAVEADEATWRAAALVIADELAETSGDPLLDETRRLYRAYPGRRGILLYLLAQMDRYDNGKVPWANLPTTFGAPVSAGDFAAYLDLGPRSFSLAPVVWPALGPGWSRAELIATRLDRYLDDPRVRQFNFQDPWLALRGIVNRLCGEKRKADISILHALFAARAAKKPSEAHAWENLVEDTGPKACR